MCYTVSIPMPTVYSEIDGLTDLQNKIMFFVKDWIKAEKTYVPRSEIFKYLKAETLPEKKSLEHAINTLIREGFLRRSAIVSNKSFYTMCRTA